MHRSAGGQRAALFRLGVRLALVALAAVCLLIAVTAVRAQAAGTGPSAATARPAGTPPPIADFFRDPQLRRPRISPDGRAIALVVTSPQNERSALAVMELEQGNKIQVVASFTDADIAQFDWVGSERLVYTAGPDQSGNWRRENFAGLWAVKRDGSERRQLILTRYGQDSRVDSRIATRALPFQWFLQDVPDDDTGEVVVGYGRYDANWQLQSVQLARLNIETQQRRILEAKSPQNVIGWALDPVGEPWALETLDGNRLALHYKNAAGDWVLAQEGTYVKAPPPSPLASDGRGLRLVVAKSGAGTQALYRVDPATLQPEREPLVSIAGFDFDGNAVFDADSRRLLGLHFQGDAPATHWFDATLKAVQADIDRALPGRVNELECRRCLKTGRVLVTSMSDTQPAEFFLYEVAERRLRALGGTRPWIRASEMAQRELVRIRARDGLEIPVMVTMPRGRPAGPRAAVMLVHGGPYVRGTRWTWEPLAQFLASRGYVVLEPEFRGSTGYGDRLFKAGWHQWGLAMQDDVSDALAWGVKQGWVDPKRVCIAGASYGGYAAMMGVIKDPAQYRCGVSWAGVTDIDYLFSLDWSDMSDVWKRYGMTAMIGDREKDAEQLRRTSPLRRAADVKVPVLIGHGMEDQRVPIDHATDFRRALDKAGHRQVEYLTYQDEGHGWRKLSTELDFYGRMERFLARHLGEGAPAAGQ